MRDHPRVRERQSATRGRDPGQLREANFDYGLRRMPDGLALRLEHLATG
ncbi:hypothetical protein ACFRCG_01055 [Embleya sp. NPDC056575]